MKTHRIVIAVIAVLIVCLGGVAARLNGRLEGEETQNAELQNKVESLEQEVAKLKETAGYYYRQGIDLQSSGKLLAAKAAFDAVVAKFPRSALVGRARQRLAAVNEAIAQADAAKAAKAQAQREKQEEEQAINGTPIDYKVFYAMAKSTGLPVGKLFRFRAQITHSGCLMNPDDVAFTTGEPMDTLCGVEFNEEAEHQQFLEGPDYAIRTVVAAMALDAHIVIYKIEPMSAD